VIADDDEIWKRGKRAEVPIRLFFRLNVVSGPRAALARTPRRYSAARAALHAAVLPAHEQGD